MSLKQYFREELKFLKEEGKEFAKIHPELSNYLSDDAYEPDVERLLEGFAFLSARLRQKISDDFPELTHAILNLLWPNYLRPIPSATIIRFDSEQNKITYRNHVEGCSELTSEEVDGQKCIFSTCYPIDFDPLVVSQADLFNTQEKSVLSLCLDVLSGGVDVALSECDDLTIHLSGPDYNALNCYAWLFNYLTTIELRVNDEVVYLPVSCLQEVGFDNKEALLPYPDNVFDGYRILQEFFYFPRKFYFFRLTKLRDVWPRLIKEVKSSKSDDEKDTEEKVKIHIDFHLSRPMPVDMQIGVEDFSLHCVPAINLFSHSADPVLLTGKENAHHLRPSGVDDVYEIFSVDSVYQLDRAGADGKDRREYAAFESFNHEVERAKAREALYYKVNVKESLDEEGFDHSIAFVRGDESSYSGPAEIIGIDLCCSNRDLPESLRIGDINERTEKTPSFITGKNIVKPTASVRPVMDASLHWTLISNFSLNYLSLLKVEPLKNIARTYDFLAMHDIQAKRRTEKRLNAILEIKTTPVDRFFKGFPVRGVESVIYIDGSQYACEGELFLFGTVLARFFGLYASINSFHILKVINTENNECYQWDINEGRQPVI